MFDPTLKKKKKTPIETPVLEEGNLNKEKAEEDFSLSTEKPKRKKIVPKILSENDPSAGLLPPGAKEGEEEATGAEQDELYNGLLERFYKEYETAHTNTDTKIVFPTPVIGRDGKKTIWGNFGETAAILGRSVEHFSLYVLTEFSAAGSINEQKQLVFKAGKYTTSSLGNITKKYYLNYVRCKSCNTSKTHFAKQDRMEFVVCDVCGSRRCVAAVTRGFETSFNRKK